MRELSRYLSRISWEQTKASTASAAVSPSSSDLVGTIGYTGVLNGSARQELADTTAWQGDTYRRDLLWGGFSLKFSF